MNLSWRNTGKNGPRNWAASYQLEGILKIYFRKAAEERFISFQL